MIYELLNVCASLLLCRSAVHIHILDTLTYIDIHLVTLIMSYESMDVHAGFYRLFKPSHWLIFASTHSSDPRSEISPLPLAKTYESMAGGIQLFQEIKNAENNARVLV